MVLTLFNQARRVGTLFITRVLGPKFSCRITDLGIFSTLIELWFVSELPANMREIN
jgi:hypothetical protein